MDEYEKKNKKENIGIDILKRLYEKPMHVSEIKKEFSSRLPGEAFDRILLTLQIDAVAMQDKNDIYQISDRGKCAVDLVNKRVEYPHWEFDPFVYPHEYYAGLPTDLQNLAACAEHILYLASLANMDEKDRAESLKKHGLTEAGLGTETIEKYKDYKVS